MPGRWMYPLFMVLAAAVFLVARHVLPKPPQVASLPSRTRLALALAAFIGGSFASKMPFLTTDPEQWFRVGTWLSDGKTILAGLMGAYVAVEIAKRMLHVQVKTGDTFALPLALALAVGRWGCFFNGCCFGRETDLPWACDFGDGVLRHPTQVYESLFHLTMAGVLLGLMGRGLLRTHRLQLYLIAYGVFRFLTEYLRPEPEWFGGLTFYQWVAVVLVVGPAVQWAWETTQPRKNA